jgi:hypothetical protein
LTDTFRDVRDSIEEKARLAEALVGAGRGALVMAMLGAGWLGWGLGAAGVFNGLTGPVFGCTELFLVGCSIFVIRRGRQLRKEFPTVAAERRPMMRACWGVVVVEVFALVVVSVLANRLGRSDLATDWCAMVAGLHFLPLARIFRAPILLVLGIVMTLWCALCWAVLRSNALTIAVSVGMGLMLWAACVSALLQARRFERQLLAFRQVARSSAPKNHDEP